MITDLYDVIIVGGGPAGLSAALVLGRCRRKVLVCDAGNPRNAASTAMHGFLSRDGVNPAEFLAMARKEVMGYGVEIREETVMAAGGSAESVARLTIFVVDKGEYLAATKDIGERYRARMGKHFPAMTLVEVKGLLEPGARVEIEATAVIER